jgi:autotransporter translocation and assembly factor TamB
MPATRRAWRWTRRILLGLAGLLVVAIAAGVIVIHTDFGREVIRKQVQATLDDTFVGGATLGKIEGSPFGEIVLRDLVINGPDHEPAIKVGTLHLELDLLPLLSHRARLAVVVAEDVDVILARDANGAFRIKDLLKPAPKSTWSVEIPKLALHRGHVALDLGTEIANLDGIEIFGAAHVPYGKPLEANVSVRAMWRERAAGVGVDAVLRSFEGVLSIPSVTAMVGGVTVAAFAVRVATGTGRAPVIDGSVFVNAPAIAVKQLAPGIELPEDVAVAVTASSMSPWTNLSVVGMAGATPVRAMLSADVERRRAMGVISSGDLDITKLTKGKAIGHGAGIVIFDALLNAPGELPTATGIVTAWGDFRDVPDAHVAIAFTSAGGDAQTIVGFANPGTRAMFAAAVQKSGDAITLERSSLIARTRDPAKASGGKAPVHGSLQVNLAAKGALTPRPNLAITGKVDGKNLRMNDLSVSSLKLAIDARQLPNQPLGRAELEMVGIVRADMQLGKLTATAANRPDGKVQVSVRSRPKQDPWLIELDALVTPPRTGQVTIVDLQRHHVRAGAGQDWTGTSGHIEIGPERIEVRDLRSASSGGTIAVAGTLDRAGRGAGDIVAKVDATDISLDNLNVAYRGKVNAHVAVQRTANRWTGDVTVKVAGVSVDPRTLTFDADARISARDGSLLVAANASSLKLGAAKLELDVHAPRDLTDVAAWRRLARSAIDKGHIALERIDLGALANLVGKPGELSGRLDGDIRLTSTTSGGAVFVRDLMAPALRGTGGVSADLQISQTAPDELAPSLVARIDGIGGIRANARIGIPDRVFDPAAWRALGRGALRSASLRVDRVALDPGLFDRFNITTQLRGQLSIAAEVSEAAKSAQLSILVEQLRGDPIAQPVDLQFVAAIDDKAASAMLSIHSKTVTLLDLKAKLPVTVDQLLANPKAVRDLPLDLTAAIPQTPAAALLAVFGRNEITGGTIQGDVVVAGTLGAPTVKLTVEGRALAVPPGGGGKPVRTIDSLSITGTWDGTTGKVVVDGVQQQGSLGIVAEGSPKALAMATVALKAKDFDLAPLLAFAPGPAGGGAGRLDANLTVTGLDPRTSKLVGELHLTDARVPIAPAVGTLRSAKIDLIAGPRDMKVDVTGKLGGGTVTVKGAFGIEGASATRGDATITLRKVSPIGTVEPIIDADVTAKVHREPDKWVADLVVKNGNVKVPEDRGEKLKEVGAPTDMVFASGEQITRRPMTKQVPKRPAIVVNVQILATHVQSEEINTVIKGKVTLTADADSVGIVGSIEAERGDVDLFGRRYQVDRAAAYFDGTTDPLLDLQITHDFPEVTTTTIVRGRLSKPELMMSSDPSTFSQGQLLGFLLGGEPGGDTTGATTRDMAAGAGTSFVANKLGGYVRKVLPVDIDVLRYEAATATQSAAVTVGTWVTRSLFLAYRRHLAARYDENTGEGQLEYWLSRRVSVEGTAGDRGYAGVDLLWRKRY